MKLLRNTFCSLVLLFSLNSDVVHGSPSPSLSAVLDKLLTNYDNRVHPYHGKKPVVIKMTGYVLAMTVNDVEQHITLSLYMRQMWLDPRLAFNVTEEVAKEGCIELHADDRMKIWIPDTFVVNEINSFVHQLTVPNQFVKICSSGAILQSTRVTMTLSCPMHFATFPFDSHICPVEIESYAMNTSLVDFEWANGKNSVGMSSDVIDPIFTVDYHSVKKIGIQLSSGNYTRLSVEIVLSRVWFAYKYNFFYPMITFACVSLVSVWLINYKLATIINLINIGVINLFMAILGSSSDVKKKVTYATAMDSYFCITNTTVVACSLVTIINLYFESRKSSSGQGIEMSRLRSESHDGTDDANLRGGDGGSRIPLWESLPSPRDLTQGRWRSILDSLEIFVKIIFRYSPLVILIVYILCNISYWINYPNQKLDIFDEENAWVTPIED